ncbi:putative intracellular protein transport protein (UsoA) [Aspergillus affinis]|uniref:putative intracellular protein transport protein (UsoA) n=1 Tax=Aspergillus affinis TaxID=1070780 RepID=UPI0022FDE588|nr:uncharacterized protein KD926_007656 [Aspergillus affinis]KAI9040848.1 hypothetical protein KD926_007656 [Aspergillus affinis]
MFRILESQAPAKQTATDTINTLSSRLQSATLLEDRRAAIQGLRSFAKLYPASVASGALRPLISGLTNDREDVDTIKVVLETLLNLFSPDENSPEASDEIALWLADEFTQRQDNITALLDLLDTREFYSRLYSLQLMFQISSARPERTQECILTAPLGIPRLVTALGDAREPVRNEALLLLIALTPASEEFQKLVAFENAFDLVFSLIETEGALTHGSEVVEDCLSLLANLLRLNISNQSYFRETGCVKRVAKLLADVNQEQNSGEPAPQWTLAHRDKNIWGLLVIIQLFLVRGGINTPANQMAFWNNGVMEQALSAAFSQRFSVNVTSKALATIADLIRGNPPLQERFGDVEVFWGVKPTEGAVNGDAAGKEFQRINVMEALLKLTLEPATIQLLDARLAACECVKAFFTHHTGIRVHVLRRAIDGHVSGQDEIPNILSVLLTPPELRGNADPYQTWMASVLMFHLLFENAEAKAIAMEVTEGDAESGEEVITCIQTIVGNLITGIQRGDDERITLGYLMLLCGWLFEEPDAVNDFLGEGSSIQTLLQEIKHRGAPYVLLTGLCTVLLGIIYEFSSKDSPIPRQTLHKLLIEQLGRDQFIDKITRFRESPAVRDFEVLPQTVAGQLEGGLLEIYFDRTFIDFCKDNFGRLTRSIDREPGLEVSVITNGVERGVSRELVDSLKGELEDRTQSIQKLESDLIALQNKLEHEQLDHRKSKETSTMEASKIKQINDSLQRNHEQELSALKQEHQREMNELMRQHGDQLRAIDNQLRVASNEHERKSQKMKEHHEAEVAELQKRIRSLESEFTRAGDQYSGEVADLKTTIERLMSDASKLKERHAAEISDLNETIQLLESNIDENNKQHTAEVSNLNEKIQSLQTEVDSAKQQHETELAELKSTNTSLQTELDSVKQQYETQVTELKSTNESLQSIVDSGKQQYDAQLADLQSKNESLQSELDSGEKKYDAQLTDLQSKNKSLQSELDSGKQQYDAQLSDLQSKNKSLQSELDSGKQQHESGAADLKSRNESLQKELDAIKKENESEIAGLKSTNELLLSELDAAKKASTQDTQAVHDDYSSKISALEKRAEEAEKKAKKTEDDARKSAETLKEAQNALEKAKSEAKEKEEARNAAQTELEDLLIVFGDLETKRSDDKKRLKDLGQEVSDEDDDDEDEDEDED